MSLCSRTDSSRAQPQVPPMCRVTFVSWLCLVLGSTVSMAIWQHQVNVASALQSGKGTVVPVSDEVLRAPTIRLPPDLHAWQVATLTCKSWQPGSRVQQSPVRRKSLQISPHLRFHPAACFVFLLFPPRLSVSTCPYFSRHIFDPAQISPFHRFHLAPDFIPRQMSPHRGFHPAAEFALSKISPHRRLHSAADFSPSQISLCHRFHRAPDLIAHKI